MILGVWAAASCMAAAAVQPAYTVQKGDTLSGIAHTHGVPLARLLERNRLQPGARLHAGQRLLIPAGSSASNPSRPAADLPGSVQRAVKEALGYAGAMEAHCHSP